MKLPRPSRVPILYLILVVLIAVGVLPLYFYATKVVGLDRETLEQNEKLLENMVTTNLAEDVAHRAKEIHAALSNLSYTIQFTSAGNLTGTRVESPEVKRLLENYVANPDSIVHYAMLVNAEGRGIYVGTAAPDAFLKKELERGVSSTRGLRDYNGEALRVATGKQLQTVMVVSTPVTDEKREYLGSLEVIVDLNYMVRKLREAYDRQGLDTFVVDQSGRLVASAGPQYATGQDMNSNELVRNFREQSGNTQGSVTKEYSLEQGKSRVAMLGTYDSVPGLDWAVMTQKTRANVYRDVIELERDALRFALIAIAFIILIGIWAARRLTTPLHVLTESSRSIAGGDFSKRVQWKSRTELGELAETFNSMTDDLEHFVDDLKKAADENRTLFLGSIQMLAGAVDEKDPYTRGHSDRVTRYSMLVATELGLRHEEIEKIRISAQLHDVGKIGIEDRILKKPGALTPEEFEIMKTHTTKGAAILRPVEMLRDMLPGIELHHESLDGRGYPFGLKGDQIPLMPRIVTVADTFDAMTTSRPYQAAMDPEYVIRIINSLVTTKFDPTVVKAMTKVFETGKLRIHRAATVTGDQAAAAAAVTSAGHSL
ncbi:MAG TPA: HD domain-containing phosphohydrolase [Candidatus Angelobacter sp.]|nr:HD domain-containing phosphohydrolase [Candidatus Angelobacter sp.]